MELAKLVEFVIGNAAVILAVLGLVEWLRSMGLRDRNLQIGAMLIGLLFGGGAYIASFGVPSDFANWFFVLLVGIIYGLIATGIVDLAGRLVSRAVAEATKSPEAVIRKTQ